MPDGVSRVLDTVCDSLNDSIAAIYLFGSFVVSGLRPDSDLDLLVVANRSLPDVGRRKLITEMLEISGNGLHGIGRPVELTVVRLADIVPWRYPPRNELVYGEWLREELEAGRITPAVYDPDLAVVLTTVRQNSLTLLGPDARKLLDPIPITDLHRAIIDSLPALTGSISGDERNVLLTLARMWVTLATNRIVSKDEAAQWVLERLPAGRGAVLARARRAYLGKERDDWTGRQAEVDAFVDWARQAIMQRFQSLYAPGPAL